MARSANGADAFLGRRLGESVAAFPGTAWVKGRDGRYLAMSAGLAAAVAVRSHGPRPVFDHDLLPADEARRARADELRVLRTRSPQVALEPPGFLGPGGWHATLRLPLNGAEDGLAGILGVVHPLTALVPLEQRVGRRPPGDGTGASVPLLVRRRLDRTFRESVRVSALARLVHKHPDHLARLFRQRVGATIAEYVRARRVAWAADQLTWTARPIVEVALDAGFADQSHLTRAFRQLLGITPAGYRRRASRTSAGEGMDLEALELLEILL